MKKEFNIIKPNLYVLNNNRVYFSAETKEMPKINRDVDKAVRNHIGQLKVQEGNLKLAKGEVPQSQDNKFTIPFNEYLDILEKEEKISLITCDSAEMFNLDYLIDARTYEDTIELNRWDNLKNNLENPDKSFEEIQKEFPYLKVNKEETLKEMKKAYESLNSKMPDYYVGFHLIPACFIHDKKNSHEKLFGEVRFHSVKSENKKEIEAAKNDLIDKLKEYDGPCLSLDAPELNTQMWSLYSNAQELIRNYGDILKDPSWNTKFFKLDP